MPIIFRATYHGIRHNKVSGAVLSFAVEEHDLAEALKVSGVPEYATLYVSVLNEDEIPDKEVPHENATQTRPIADADPSGK